MIVSLKRTGCAIGRCVRTILILGGTAIQAPQQVQEQAHRETTLLARVSDKLINFISLLHRHGNQSEICIG